MAACGADSTGSGPTPTPTSTATTKPTATTAPTTAPTPAPTTVTPKPPSCTDGEPNGKETDLDCGGLCPPCDDGKKCGVAADCTSSVCDATAKECSAPSCTDVVKNGTETDLDCGGTCTSKCATAKSCLVGGDCASGVCDAATKKCVAPACNDAVKNDTETDVDCGGTCATKCAVAKSCAVTADCDKSLCEALHCRYAKSCSEIKAATPASPDGVYMIDPDGAAGAAAFSVHCDMTTDGGGWTKILQYHDVAYTPTAAASGDVTTALTPAFAKLSDASINALGTALGGGRAYRIQGPTSPAGQKLFVFSTGVFDDTAVGLGLMGAAIDVCESATFAGCVKQSVGATYIDSLAWGLVGNDAERYFADYAGGNGVNCYNPSATGVRCFNAGVSTGHAFIPDLSIWLK
jgi:hypothetical protein